ncbi:hypothetical protein PF004_g28703 [Phytophthora fragariae]|uniref:Uncharacterized protein n=1 Tax=Phytophthora fragariae TaxID=53985 RepID=A0A6A3H5G7_9STRA|nr:hypothetical protein PF011_g28670 [Phytophthora fragariae]KAE9167796.1 hypothetical protein PF004_g28703 [Phytophthora fragariae]
MLETATWIRDALEAALSPAKHRSATPVYPTTTAQLVAYLKDSVPRVIVLNKTFDFRGTEGTTTEAGCRPDYTRACIA